MRAVDHPFKIHAWDAACNHAEEELAVFSNQIVAARCWDAFVRYYAKRRLILRHGRGCCESTYHLPSLAWIFFK
jgi:hypothetical protein